MGKNKILRFLLATVVLCVVFLSGSAVGIYFYTQPSNQLSNLSKPVVVDRVVQPVQNDLVGQLSGPVAGVINGYAVSVTENLLTVGAENPGSEKAKGEKTKTISITEKTLFIKRIKLSVKDLDALGKKASADTKELLGGVFIPPKTYTENNGKFSDIKIGMEVGVMLSSDSGGKATNDAAEIYYYIEAPQ
jgi:hypothetical protein